MNGQTISHYKVLRPIGKGALGCVYQAEDTILRRQVALKFLPRELTGDPDASRRFVREARATSNIDHPNICNIHEIGETSDGALFIAMTWYEGQTLKKCLDHGKLTVIQSLEFAQQIASGLARAHESGVVHRDIKPANIIVTKRNELKIVDFGLARLVTRARLTNHGTIMGTAAYMAPEQARGEDAQPASDVWSVGVVLYEMLMGHLPFYGDHEVAIIYSVLNIDPMPLDLDICPEGCHSQTIISKCLAKDFDLRYDSADELVEDLEEALLIAKKNEPMGDGKWWNKGLRKTVGLAAASLVAFVLLFAQSGKIPGEIFSIFNHEKSHGIAILPFSFSGATADDQALANGLSWFTADMVSRLENETDKFWLVPPGVTQKEKITDGLRAQRVIGIGHTVSGAGRIQGDWISLRITINDAWEDYQVTYTLEDNLANLKTWQLDLPLLIVNNLDPELGQQAAEKISAGMTNVPAAFRSYLMATGYAFGVAEGQDYKKAIDFFSASVDQDSSFACSWSGLGYATYQESKGDDPEGIILAEQYLRTASSLYSGHPAPWVHLGDILANGEEPEEARALYLEALALNGKSENALRGLWNLERFAGNTERARDYLKQALDARPQYYGTIYDYGVFSYYNGNLDQAEEFFQQLVELAPQQQEGYNLLGATLFEMNNYPDSKLMFESSLAIEPSYMAYSNLGTLYFYSGRLLDAAEMARKALALEDDRFEAWRTLAEAQYWTPGLRDSSQTAFLKCAGIISEQLAASRVNGSEGNAELRSDLATVQVRLGRFEEAQELLSSLEKESHLETPTMFNLASAFEQMQNREKALLWLEKAVAADLSFGKVEQYPGLRNLRTHPQYLELRAEYGER